MESTSSRTYRLARNALNQTPNVKGATTSNANLIDQILAIPAFLDLVLKGGRETPVSTESAFKWIESPGVGGGMVAVPKYTGEWPTRKQIAGTTIHPGALGILDRVNLLRSLLAEEMRVSPIAGYINEMRGDINRFFGGRQKPEWVEGSFESK